MPTGRGAKEKGATFERDLAEHLNDALGLQAARMPLSGGGSWSAEQGAGLADLTGTPGLHIEAKRTERLDIRGALRQAVASTSKRRSPDLPTVITRRNREPLGDSIVAMRLDDFVQLYDAWLRLNGHTKDAAP